MRALDRLPLAVRDVFTWPDAPPASPRQVVFDADGTLWRGDVGEDLLRFLAAEGHLPGRPEGVYARYEALVARAPADAYAFAVQVMAGLSDERAAALSEAFVAQRFAGRIFWWVRPVFEWLGAQGAQVWICSASPRWPVEAGAALLGVPRERVIGVDAKLDGGLLTREVLPPVPCGEGKVGWLAKRGVRPALAVGNGDLDLPMLASAQRALVIATPDGPDNALVEAGQSRGWPVLRC